MTAAALGLDLGGSHSRALLLAEDGRVLARAAGGPGNLAVAGEKRVAAAIAALVAGTAGPRPPLAVCCGAAGADAAVERHALERMLTAALPGLPIQVVSDAPLVLAAAGLDEGVALIAGTGSIAYGVAGGRTVRVGGWGPRLGDHGSGYWAVRDAVAGILRAHDLGIDLDAGQRRLLESARAGDPIELAHLFHRQPDPSRWAALSAIALADPDRLQRAAGHLAALAAAARRRLGAEVPVVLAGGLLLGTPALEKGVRGRLAGPVLRLTEEPVLGAARMAWKLAGYGASRGASAP